MAEGRAELAQETAEREAKAQQDGATLEARLAASSRYENMAVALAAIYRETFAPELKAAKEANRSAVHLLCVPIPDEEVAPWKKLLARDFDAGDEAQAREAIADTHDAAEAMARSTDGELAVWIARFAHLATGSAAVGYLEAREALDASSRRWRWRSSVSTAGSTTAAASSRANATPRAATSWAARCWLR